MRADLTVRHIIRGPVACRPAPPAPAPPGPLPGLRAAAEPRTGRCRASPQLPERIRLAARPGLAGFDRRDAIGATPLRLAECAAATKSAPSSPTRARGSALPASMPDGPAEGPEQPCPNAPAWPDLRPILPNNRRGMGSRQDTGLSPDRVGPECG